MIKKLFSLSGLKISLVITIIFLGMFFLNYLEIGSKSFMELIDKNIVDLVIRSQGVTLKNNHVAIAAVDTKSVDFYGRWPWGRNIMADLLHELEAYYKVKVVGYDIVFSEPDPNDIVSEQVLNSFYQRISKIQKDSESIKESGKQMTEEMNNDGKFGVELSKWNNIVLGYFFYLYDTEEQIKHLTEAQLAEFEKRIENSEFTVIQGAQHLSNAIVTEGQAVEANIVKLNPKNCLNGFFNSVPDFEDGVIRRVPAVIRYKDMYYPSLDLQMVRRYFGDPPLRMQVDVTGIEAVFVGKHRINTDANGSVMVNYRGPKFTFPHYSIYDIINHNIPIDKLEGKIVLLGATETGAFDLRTTPEGNAYPGVEVHANMIDNMLVGDYFFRSEYVQMLTFVFILVFGLIMGLILPRLRALPGLIFSVVLLVGYASINLWVLINYRSWTSFIYIIGVIFVNWFVIILYKFFGEEKDKRFIKGAFQQYLSPTVIDQLVENPKLLKLGGEKKEITAFFSDVQGFSTISESLEPEELVELLNEYLTAMTDILLKYDGTIDKFEGDAVIGFFGAPIAYSDHAAKACLASLEMQKKLAEMRKVWKEQGKHELFVRIGLNTGDTVVGNMGSAYRMDYTMMGDTVNLAARLEGVNKQYKTYCLVSQFTYEQCKEIIEARELDQIKVVGKNEPVRIFEIVGKKGEVGEEKLKAFKFFAKGLQLYRQQQWDEAVKYFSHASKQLDTDGPSQVFIERCKRFKINPPGEGWDGVYKMAQPEVISNGLRADKNSRP